MSLIVKLFHFVTLICGKYNIDESHGLQHSMDVLQYANNIYENELIKKPYLITQEKLIYVSAIVHDLCDKKYMNENEGITNIENFLQDKMTDNEIAVTKNIISTMSYSTVKKNGFPNLGIYQDAYNIVREADLLSAYDFDRCMIYNIRKQNGNIEDAYDNACILFQNRVFKHNEHGLLITDYAKQISKSLEVKALTRIDNWKKILKKPTSIS